MKNAEYWKKRSEAVEKQLHKQSEEYCKEVEKQFKTAEKKLSEDIEKWYVRLADNNDISLAEARKLLDKDQLQEFKWTVEEYIKHGKENGVSKNWEKELENASAKWHIRKLEAIQLQMQHHLEVLYAGLAAGLTEHLSNTYKDAYYRKVFSMQQGFELGATVTKLDGRRVGKALEHCWAMDGKLFSDRIWQNKETLTNELNTILTQSIIRGENPGDYITALSKKMNTSRNNASRIIYTESAAIAAQADKDCYKELGIEEFEFLATLDSHTSKICREMDGRHFPMSEYKIGVNVPPLHPFCRSTTCPYFDDEFTIGEERAARGEDGKVNYVPGNMTYEEWYEEYVNKKESFSNNAETDTIISGAVSGARNPYGEKAREHAEKYYGLVRKMTTDVDKISETTGISRDKIQEIKNFIFLEKHQLGGMEPEYFAPDYMMAESWRRLIDGKPEPHDITLINHELMEKELMKSGMSQKDAHIVTSKTYNYDKEASEFYDNIKKYKKE